jgi:hypothetical protein
VEMRAESGRFTLANACFRRKIKGGAKLFLRFLCFQSTGA